MTYSPYQMFDDKNLIESKRPMNTLKVDRTVIRNLHLEHGLEYDQFDTDMIIEFRDDLISAGFDMNRVEDIEVVKEFTMENNLIFIQPDVPR